MSDALLVFPYLLLNQTFLYRLLCTPGLKYPLWKEDSCSLLVGVLFLSIYAGGRRFNPCLNQLKKFLNIASSESRSEMLRLLVKSNRLLD